jgi:hypothetical protein
MVGFDLSNPNPMAAGDILFAAIEIEYFLNLNLNDILWVGQLHRQGLKITDNVVVDISFLKELCLAFESGSLQSLQRDDGQGNIGIDHQIRPRLLGAEIGRGQGLIIDHLNRAFGRHVGPRILVCSGNETDPLCLKQILHLFCQFSRFHISPNMI